MAREKIIDRVQKLLRLSQNNSSVEEASSAAALAQKLMFEHKISRVEVDAGANSTDDDLVCIDVLAREGGTKVVGWAVGLLHAVAQNNFCRVVQTSATRQPSGATMRPGLAEVFGKRGDVDTVLYLYGYLKREINRLCQTASERYSAPHVFGEDRDSRDKTNLALPGWLLSATRPSRRRWANAFRHGAVATIRLRLQTQRRRQEDELQVRFDGDQCLTVVRQAEAAVDRFVENRYPDLRAGARHTIADMEGYVAGQQAARHIALDTAAKRGLREPPLGLPH